MHNTFQRDLCRLKLETARSYVKAISTSMMPMATSQSSSLKVTAQVWFIRGFVSHTRTHTLTHTFMHTHAHTHTHTQVQGLGPLFRLTVIIQNTSPSSVATDHYITFKCDESLYRISNKLLQVSFYFVLLCIWDVLFFWSELLSHLNREYYYSTSLRS